MSGYDLDIQLTDLEYVSSRLVGLRTSLKQKTAPIIAQIARDVATRAKAGVRRDHPSNFFVNTSNGKLLNPNYRVSKQGDFYYQVQTPGSAAGKAEAIAEFAAKGFTPQGAGMVRALSSIYGRQGGSGNGRILYKARDDMEAEIVSRLEAAVNNVADKAL